LTFNFETISVAHQAAISTQDKQIGVPITTMVWSKHHHSLPKHHKHTHIMVSGDEEGNLALWNSSLANLERWRAHELAVYDASFAPNDLKFVSCSEDKTISLWDTYSLREERVFKGHLHYVRTVCYHPSMALFASGSKDNFVNLWDPRAPDSASGTGNSGFFSNDNYVVARFASHKNTVTKVLWGANGHDLASCSRDSSVRIFDLRTMREREVFRGHHCEVTGIVSFGWNESFFCFVFIHSDDLPPNNGACASHW
jgi:polyadenylation factor subunit 2